MIDGESELEYYRKCVVELYSLPRFGSIATGIAHNMNSPLGGVIGYAQLALMKNPDVKGLDRINQQAFKISQMLAGLSEKGQSELTQTETEINLNELIKKELKFLDFNLFFKHQVVRRIQLNDIPSIRGVYYHWSHIFNHLIQNAIDSMFETQKKNLTIITDFEKGKIILTIKDSGEGISPEDIDNIFIPGFKRRKFPWETENDDEPSGFGLGLFIVKELLKKYNSEIRVKSNLDVGTETIITIPIN